MPTHIPNRSFLPALTLLVLACSNDRVEAVKNTLAFAQEAPYIIATPAERSSGSLVAVKDSALRSYNRVFQYFEPKDTTRATVYGMVPGNLLLSLPVTRLDHLTSKQLPADTVQVIAVFSRPEPKLFEKTLFELVPTAGTSAPTANQQLEFQRFIARAKQGLQDTDTALFWVINGPRIVRFVTARQIRDSIAAKAIADAELKEFARVITAASFTNLAAKSYPIAPAYNLDGGGNITGLLDPGAGGWPKPSTDYADMHVACEARNGEQVLREVSYIILKRLSPHEKDKVLCLWLSEAAQIWNGMHPNSFRVRLIGVAGRDSVLGEWTEVTPR